MKYFLPVALTLSAHLCFAVSYKNADQYPALAQTSQAFTSIAEKNIPAVVLIKTEEQDKRGATSDFFGPLADPLFEDFLRRFFGGHRMSRSIDALQSSGSGFFVSSHGHILTNHHVIKEAKRVCVVTHEGQELEANIVGTDPKTDLAVLKVDLTDVPYIEFANSDELVTGEQVVAIGHPFELSHTFTAGVVSATPNRREHLSQVTKPGGGGVIQTDAAINPGNSGGPLLNLDGKAVGVNVAILTNTKSFAGISFAIPSSIAKHVFEKIVEDGSVNRAFLGIVLQNIDPELAEATNLEPNTGILIAEVMQDSPAYHSGLKNGDIILEMNGEGVKSVNTFCNQIALMSPDTPVSLKVQRNAETFSIDIILGVLSENSSAAQELFQKLGLELEDFSDLPPEMLSRYGHSVHTPGVLVTQVLQGSPARSAGIAPNQIITGLVISWDEQRKIGNKEDLHAALQEVQDRKHVVLIVKHKNFQRYCTLRMD
ncbi:MAG: trypsin-like peptidase domain-containing protein [Chlamydiota bacterium]